MRKVLIIAHAFPPMGGSGVQRTSKFVKHLRAFGYEPVVLTRQINRMALKDESLLKDIPEGVLVERTPDWDLAERLGIMGKAIARKVLIPDGERLWEMAARKPALSLIRGCGIELIYSTSTPYSDHLLGLYIRTKLPRIKWVADFRDEWTNNPYTLDKPHNPVRAVVEKRMERRVLAAADSLIANTPVMRRNFLNNNRGIVDEARFYVIPNGYDAEDFAGLEGVRNKNERFTITYTGLLYGRRKPDFFFEALRNLIRSGRIAGDCVRVQLIGNYHADKLNALIAAYGLAGVVKILGYMRHGDCVREQLKSDALLLLEGEGVGADAFYTGKIFEYMNTGRPVLGVLPEGAARDLLERTRIGISCGFSDVRGIENSILKLYNDWREGSHAFEPDRGEIMKYERKVLTRELAGVFDRTLLV